MTQSNTRLTSAARQLGEYYFDHEWDLIEDEFIRAEGSITTLEQFKRWVTGYMYYNVVVCFCGGDEDAINSQLEDDWAELGVIAACEPATLLSTN